MKKQQGAVLIVGLVVLMVMTLIGVTSISTTTSQLKMANNLQTQQWAFQGTEAVASYFSDGADKDANPYAIDWDLATTQSETDLDEAGSGQSLTSLDVVYKDCMTVLLDQGLTGDSQDGSSGGFRGIVHDLEIASSAVNADDQVIGQKNSRVNGIQTVSPGCPSTGSGLGGS